MEQRPIILWLRQDLRLSDHPALHAATKDGRSIVPVYVLDKPAAGKWAPGGASRWWLHGSLSALGRELAARGSRLVLRRGDTQQILMDLAAETGASAVYCTRTFEPEAVRLERRVHDRLALAGIELKRFGGFLLEEPDSLSTRSGEHFKVFTPFWRELSSRLTVKAALPAPTRIPSPAKMPAGEALDSWRLLPAHPDWAGGLREAWEPGEAGASRRLEAFLSESFRGYAENRNRPDWRSTSRLSPHLHFGEIAPHAVWRAATRSAAVGMASDRDLEVFLKELAWREFSYHLLVHRPDLPDSPFRPEFARYPWHDDAAALAAWQRGRTGYPIVDAGMRELWHTGWMHNRVRMIVGSFLVKDLRIDWRKGEAWFWDTLVDADLANNAASWQWVTGSGADAAPYFRIFNPVVQGQKFDPEGAYVRRWLPELARLPNSTIHAPWQAAAPILAQAEVRLGETYPLPIVDHSEARAAALAGFEELKRVGPRHLVGN